MTTHCLGRSLFLASFVLTLLAACEPIAVVEPSGDRRITATLLTDGNTVRVNGRKANAGQPIRPGDLVTTGPGSSALIRFSDGTTVQLDENTDPIFRWTGDELQIRMEVGAIEVEKGVWIKIVEVIGDLADFFTFSDFVVEEQRTRFIRVDLFSGRMQMTRPQTGPVQPGGEYFLVRAGSAEVEFGRTSARRKRELRRRFDHWNFVEPIRMPNLIDLGLPEALRKIERAGLRRGIISGPTSGPLEVTGQHPRAGTMIDRRARVDLTVRPVVVTVRVPDLSEMSLRRAQRKIERDGLRLGRVTGARSGDRYVVDQRPAPGTRVREGSPVNLELKARPVVTIPVPEVNDIPLPEVIMIPVPEVRRLLLRTAISTLERAGLKLGRVSGSQGGDAVFVTDQFPKPGFRLPRGSAVNLTVRGVIQ